MMSGVGVKKNSTLNKSTFSFSIDINIEFINSLWQYSYLLDAKWTSSVKDNTYLIIFNR